MSGFAGPLRTRKICGIPNAGRRLDAEPPRRPKANLRPFRTQREGRRSEGKLASGGERWFHEALSNAATFPPL
jgi:hypothetical protein